MSDYIITKKNTLEHYTYKQNEGIIKKSQHTGRWASAQSIYKDGLDGFCVFADKNDCIHILSTNKKGELVYIFEKNNSLHTHTLLSGNDKVYPKTIRSASDKGRTSIIYSADYNGETLLIYCILGVNAKPLHIDTLSPEHQEFAVAGTRIYYTNTDNILGYMDFSDGKPDTFIPICENAHMPTAIIFDNTEHLIYKKENFIIHNGNNLFEDKHAQKPLLCISSGKLLLLWKSMNYIKYSASQNGGATWSPPMRFVNSGSNASIFTVQSGSTFCDYYGTASSGELHLIGAGSLFSPVQTAPVKPQNDTPDEYNNLKSEIAEIKAEINELKKHIANLTALVSSIGDKGDN